MMLRSGERGQQVAVGEEMEIIYLSVRILLKKKLIKDRLEGRKTY